MAGSGLGVKWLAEWRCARLRPQNLGLRTCWPGSWALTERVSTQRKNFEALLRFRCAELRKRGFFSLAYSFIPFSALANQLLSSRTTADRVKFMGPLPRPQGAPQNRRGVLELFETHLHTARSSTHTLVLRSLESPIGTASALYIFLGILISLCIAAPIIGRLRKSQRNDVADYILRAKRAAVEVDGKVAELASLQQRQDSLVQEQEQYQTSQQQQENQLRDAMSRFQTLQQQIRDLEQSMRDQEEALTVAGRERDAALAEGRQARQLHSTTLEVIQNLESEVQTKEEDLRSLQQKYNHVDQEYRQLMCEMGGSES